MERYEISELLRYRLEMELRSRGYEKPPAEDFTGIMVFLLIDVMADFLANDYKSQVNAPQT